VAHKYTTVTITTCYWRHGRTVWDMADTFKVALADVTWDMLEKVQHKPTVIVKPNRLSRERDKA